MLGEYHAALGELVFRFEGTLERFAGDGLMVFFNDPVPLRRTRPRGRCGWRVAMRDAGARAGRGVARGRATTSAFGIGIAQGFATLGRIGFEGRFDYAAIGSVTNLAARLCAEARAVADPRHPAGASPAAGRRDRGGEDVGPRSCAGFSRPRRTCSTSSGLDKHGTDAMTRRPWHARRPPAADVLADLDEDERVRRVRRAPGPDARGLGRDAAATTTTSRSSSSLDDPRPGRGRPAAASTRRWRSASCSCCCCCASRGCGWST